MNGKFGLDTKLATVEYENCFISEITLAELKFGIENSQNPQKNRNALNNFLSGITILPILNCLDIFAKEKTRLRKVGNKIDDFDLLIGSSAVENKMTLVTNNVKHLERIKNIKIEDWTK